MSNKKKLFMVMRGSRSSGSQDSKPCGIFESKKEAEEFMCLFGKENWLYTEEIVLNNWNIKKCIGKTPFCVYVNDKEFKDINIKCLTGQETPAMKNNDIIFWNYPIRLEFYCFKKTEKEALKSAKKHIEKWLKNKDNDDYIDKKTGWLKKSLEWRRLVF